MAFVHERLDLKSNVIRLLTIQGYDREGNIVCRLVHAPVEESRYYALSYTWGDSAEQKTILINGKPFRVRSNLWSFLNHASQLFKGIPFWVDAVCIHQNRQLERNHQVQLMGTIYRQAQRVLVWLGSGDKGLSRTFSVLQNQQPKERPMANQMDQYADSSVIPGPNDSFEHAGKDAVHHMRLSGIARICELDYWSRTWIVQELLLAQHIDLMYEHDVVSWEVFWSQAEKALTYRFWNILCEKFGNLDIYGTTEDHSIVWSSLAFKHYKNRLLLLDKPKSADEPKSLSALINEYKSTACSNKLDRVYGLISLVRGGTHFPVRYGDKPVELAHRASAFFDTDINLFECLLTCLQVSEKELLRYWRTAAGWTGFKYAHHPVEGGPETELKLDWCQLKQSVVCVECRDEMPVWEGFEQMRQKRIWDMCKIICLQPPGISGVPLGDPWHLFAFWHSSNGDPICVRPTALSSCEYHHLYGEGGFWRTYTVKPKMQASGIERQNSA